MATPDGIRPASKRFADFPFALFVLLACSLALGYLVARASAFYKPTGYTPDWGSAQWIGGREEAATRYFRRRFYVEGIPKAAYLLVAGTDEVSVYINGLLMVSERYIEGRVTEIRDLKERLVDGQNIIAVKVEAMQWTTQPLVLARIVVENGDGGFRELASDRTWKASSREARDAGHQVDWTALGFNDSSWPDAIVEAPPRELAQLPLDLPEDVFSSPPATWYLWSQRRNPQVTLVRDFELYDSSIRGAWLQIGFSGHYSVAINGHLLHAESSGAGSAELLSVGQHLRQGHNRIELAAVSPEVEPRIYARLLIDTPTGRRWETTDGRWLSARQTLGPEASYSPIHLVSKVGSRMADRQTRLVATELSSGPQLDVHQWRSTLLLALSILAASALAFLLFHLAIKGAARFGAEQSLGLFSQPFLLGLLLAVLLLLVESDPRWRPGPDTYADYATFAPVTAIAAVLLSALCLVALEARRRRHGTDDKH
ncbi:MAG: hypothetical protein ACK2UN_06180 [Candidatus Promineifilaceae bacterium]